MAELNPEKLLLGGRYELDLSHPLPDLAPLAGEAFAAKDTKDPKFPLYTILLTSDIPARFDRLSGFKSLVSTHVSSLVAWGPVAHGSQNRRYLALVLDRPQGRRFWTDLQSQNKPVHPDHLRSNIMKSLLAGVHDLHQQGLTHGNIRPDMLFTQDLSSGGLVLAEAVSAPCGYKMPVLFETVERGMADEIARGESHAPDDMYALGITLLLLALGYNPTASIPDERIITAKIEQGTFPALVPTAKLHSSLLEPLRGMLTDNSQERWTLHDLELWVSGRRLSPIQPSVLPRASRPFELDGHKYWTMRSLSYAFKKNPKAGIRAIDSGDVDRWIRRTMGREKLADKIQEAIATARVTGGNAGKLEDRILARVGMVLDPEAPFYFKGRVSMPEGLGPAIAKAMVSEHDLDEYVAAISAQLPIYWYSVQEKFKPDYQPLLQRFDQMRSFLERRDYGFGPERVLYELNPSIACLSPITRKYYPTTTRTLLQALEKVSEEKPEGIPIDRHIAAFIASQRNPIDASLLRKLDSKADEYDRILAILTILAQYQKKEKITYLPGLCHWAARLSEVLIDHFHGKTIKEVLHRKMGLAVKSGQIAKVLNLVNDPSLLTSDHNSYQIARRKMRNFDVSERLLQRQVADKDRIMRTTGRQFAAMISGAISALAVVLIVVLYLG